MQQFLNRSFQGLHQYLQFPYGATKFDFASVSKNVLYGVGNLTVRYVRLQFQMAKCAHGCATRSNKSYLIDEGPLFCQMAAPSLESGLLQNWGAITTPILVEAKPHPRCAAHHIMVVCDCGACSTAAASQRKQLSNCQRLLRRPMLPPPARAS